MYRIPLTLNRYIDFIINRILLLMKIRRTWMAVKVMGQPLDHYELNRFSDPQDGNWRKLSEVIADLCISARQGTKAHTDSRSNLEPEATRPRNLTPPPAMGVVFSGSNNSGI